MENINNCARCGKNIDIRDRSCIDFMFNTIISETYYVCESCYKKILRYTLTRPVNKEDK